MTPHCFRHAANDCEKEMRHGCPSPPSLACLHMDFRTQREESEGTICPYPQPPSSLRLSLSKDDAGIHMQAQRQIPRRICQRSEQCCDFSPVCFFPPGLLKARTRHNRVLCDFKTLITHSTSTYTCGILNIREATQVG